MNDWVYLVLIMALWNIVTFALYGIDKRKAIKSKRRISEKSLILCAFIMGSVGALLGMSVFRHKTKHLKFKLLLPVALIINTGIVALVWYYFGQSA
jgi:uncharacterized membrane protein YsdA (DUF1294 family)